MAGTDHSVTNGQSGPKVQLANCISGDYQISNQDKDPLSGDDIKAGAGESSNYSQLNFQRRRTLATIMRNPDPESSSSSDLLYESRERFSDIRESTPVQDRALAVPMDTTLPNIDKVNFSDKSSKSQITGLEYQKINLEKRGSRDYKVKSISLDPGGLLGETRHPNHGLMRVNALRYDVRKPGPGTDQSFFFSTGEEGSAQGDLCQKGGQS